MIDCPNCGRQLMPDSSNPMRMKCTYCNYVLDPAADTDPLPGLFPEEDQTSSANPPQGQPVIPAVPASSQDQGFMPPQGEPVVMSPAAPPQKLSKGFAIASLVLGIVAVLNCWIPLVNFVAIVLGILALVFGILSLVRINKNQADGKGMSIAGVICGGAALLLSIIISVFTIIVINAIVEEYKDYYDFDDYDTYEELLEYLYDYENYDSAYDSRHHQRDRSYSTSGDYTFSDDAAWTSMSFIMDGKSYTLLQTTFEDFGTQSGWTIDLAAAGYPQGYIVQPYEEIDGIQVTNESNPDAVIILDVYNPGRDQRDMRSCVLSAVWIVQGSQLAVELPGGIHFGDSFDAATSAYGPAFNGESGETEPTPVFDSVLTFYTSDFEKSLNLFANESGTINGMYLAYWLD